MTHFALICPPFPSHLRAFEALGERLRARGHRATFILPEGAEQVVASQRLDVVPVGQGRNLDLDAIVERTQRPTGPLGILRTVSDAARLTDHLCAEAAPHLSWIGADAVIGDQMEPAAGLLAAHAGLPFLSLACALPIDRDAAIPPPFLDWPYDPSPEGLKRNRGAERVTRLFLGRQRRTVREWALRFGLPGRFAMEDCLSPLGTISQTVESFDFPRRGGRRLHHVGPIRGEARKEALPFESDGRPLVYASLGTLQGHRLSLFRTIAKAAHELDVQLVISHCGGLTDEEAASLPASYVTADLPQRAVLEKAAACITHGGLNTVLDAMEFGVPVLAVPIAFDQPGVAARVEHHGAGLKLSRVLLSERAVRSSLRRLIDEKGFRERARAIGADIERAGGVEAAADIVEDLLVRARRRLPPAQLRAPEPAF